MKAIAFSPAAQADIGEIFLDYADHLDVIRVLHQRQDAEQHLPTEI